MSIVSRLEAWYERLAFPAAPPPHIEPARVTRRLAAAEFIEGINLPWLNYGCDFGASAWRPGGGVSDRATRATLCACLDRIAAGPERVVRWFAFCDGRAGVRTDQRGAPVGLDDRVFADFDAAFEELDRRKLRALMVLFDFPLLAPSRYERGVQLGGRQHWISNPATRDSLLQQVVAPLVCRYGAAAPLFAWDVLNEPEWMTRGFGGRRRAGAVSHRTMHTFLGDAVVVARSLTAVPLTVGLSSTRGLDLVEDLDLDFYQVHWYDRHSQSIPLGTPVADLRVDRPVLLGEYPTRGSALAPLEIVATARAAGYAGALAWSAHSQDDASDVDWYKARARPQGRAL